MQQEKQDWFLKSSSADISFCSADCLNKNCDRNLKGELFERYRKTAVPCQYYSCSDFEELCTSYQK